MEQIERKTKNPGTKAVLVSAQEKSQMRVKIANFKCMSLLRSQCKEACMERGVIDYVV